jgi:hypothetical protein
MDALDAAVAESRLPLDALQPRFPTLDTLDVTSQV